MISSEINLSSSVVFNKVDSCKDILNNEIVKRFTGEDGVACSKIAFTNNCTKFKEIYVVDYDGYNLRRFTKDNKLNILPKWVPYSSVIIYTSYLRL